MEVLGFLLSLCWLSFFVSKRGRGSLGMRSVACFESLACTLLVVAILQILAWLFFEWEWFQRLVGTFFVYSEIFGIVGTGGFLVLALLPERRLPNEGTGLSPLKGE